MRLPKRASLLGAIFAVVGASWAGATAVHAAEPVQLGNGIEAGTSYQNDVSLPLYYLPEWQGDEDEAREQREAAVNPKIPTHHVNSDDPVIQNLSTHAPGGYMPAPILSFDGMANSCGCSPPDTNGEVGETQYVQMTNSGYQVFDKVTGASLLGPKATSSIWAGFGGVCETSGAGDPVVLYDQLAKRWVITQFAGGSVITDECIAVSTSSDATASYYRYGFHLGSNFFDYPHLGMWPDGYYMSMNVFNAAGTAYLGPQAFAFDRTAMLAGTPATFLTTTAPMGNTFAPLLPADLDGSNPPPLGAPNPFVEFPDSNNYNVYRFHADFATPANTTFALAGSPAAAGFTTLCGSTRSCVPQKGTSVGLDGIGDRFMFRLAYRNFGDHESLVGNYTVKANNVAAPRWFELRGVTSGSATVYQEGTYQPDTDWRWMGSAAMDVQGNLAIGYSASSSTIYPQLRYAGRLVGDPLGTLGQAEAHLFDGTSNQTLSGNRWGDYSDLTVDPVDDCTFWYTNEYGIGGNYKTRIGNFKFPGCSISPGFTLSATPNSTGVCAGSPATFTVNVAATAGFAGAVTLAGSGNPAPSTLVFNPLTVPTLPGSSVLTVANTAGVTSGSYPITINGTATGASAQSTTVNLGVFAGVPAAPTLVAPADLASNQPRTVVFSWSGGNAQDYTIDIATDVAFNSIIATATVSGTSFTPAAPLQPLTTYYWRVRSNSPCGNSTLSPAFSFTTGVTFPEPYCSVAFPSAVEPITRVKFSGIDNASSAVVDGSPALEDFLGVAGGAASPGSTYAMTVEGNTAGSYTTKIKAFIDWNHNGVFDASEGYVIGDLINSTGADGKQVTANIAVPAGALSGPTRMRVIKKYNSAPVACETAGYGQAEDYTLSVAPAGPTYTVGGTVAGLSGTGLTLKLNGGTGLPVAANGAFTFPDNLPASTAYAVTIGAQPSGQSCTVANGSGTIVSANVTNVAVTCTTLPTYTVGGTVSGLTGSGLALKLNGGAALAINANGAFTFPDGLTSGTAYAVTVSTQPSSPVQTCTVANGTGTMGGANVTTVSVTCIDGTPPTYTVGGSVSGLAGSGLLLKLNGGPALPVAANGGFMFPDNLVANATYAVTIGAQPSNPTQLCSITNGSGTIGTANVTNVAVTCVTATPTSFTVGGTVSGLVGTGLKLKVNNGSNLLISGDGPFVFSTQLATGDSYTVAITNQPIDQACTLANASGTIGTANVTDVQVTCVVSITDRIFADGFEGAL